MSWPIRIGLCLVALGILVPSVGYLLIDSSAADDTSGTAMVANATPVIATFVAGVALVLSGVLLALIDWMRH